MRHPEVRDICDAGRIILGGSRAALITVAIMFVMNNVAIMAIHLVLGGQILESILDTSGLYFCHPAVFCALVAILCCIVSMVRKLEWLSNVGFLSAVCAFVALMMVLVFLAIQGRPATYHAQDWIDHAGITRQGGEPIFSFFPDEGTTWRTIMVGIFVLSFCAFGQTTLPTIVSEMKQPKDFPKALWTCTSLVTVLFVAFGTSISVMTGSQYMTSPVFGSLEHKSKLITICIIAFPTLVLGVLYSAITGRFVTDCICNDPDHAREYTKKGWSVYVAVLIILWTGAFILSQIIPFFSSLLALIGAVFDGFFGFIIWALAWFHMRKQDIEEGRAPARMDRVQYVANVCLIIVGLVVYIGVGSAASVMDIMDMFAEGKVGGVFSCVATLL